MPPREVPDRNLALELVRVTEAAALAAGRWVGMGDKEAADQAAVDGMHAVLHTIHMDGVVVIGEGEKDEAPMLHNGEQVGDGSPPAVDIAVDPLEGTRLCALGMPNALAVIALAEKGAMFDPGPCVYMQKMAGADDVADLLDLDRPLGKTIELVAERRGSDVRDVMVVVLDRPRHEEGIQAIRDAGGRVRLITDGDVAGALLAVSPRTPASLLWGIGGTPEGVISAAGIKCMGGAMIGRLWPRDDDERKAAEDRARSAGAGPRGPGPTPPPAPPPPTPSSGAPPLSSPRPASPTATSPGVPATGARAAPRRSRSSCARAGAPCAGSPPATTAR